MPLATLTAATESPQKLVDRRGSGGQGLPKTKVCRILLDEQLTSTAMAPSPATTKAKATEGERTSNEELRPAPPTVPRSEMLLASLTHPLSVMRRAPPPLTGRINPLSSMNLTTLAGGMLLPSSSEPTRK